MSKRTEINDVSLELGLDLRLNSQERTLIRGIECSALDIDCEGCSVLNVSDVAAELDVGPVIQDFVVQGLELGDILVLVLQLGSSFAKRSHVLRVLPLARPQLDDLPIPAAGKNAAVADDLPDLIEAALEPTHSANTDVVLTCTALVLVLDACILAKDVAIADSVDLVAGVAVLVLILVKPEGESALGILLLHLFGRDGKVEKSSEESTDVVGGIVAADMTHEGLTCEPRRNCLAPFHNNIVNIIFEEKRRDLLADLMGGVGGGRARNDTNRYDDETETPLLLLSLQSVGDGSEKDPRPTS